MSTVGTAIGVLGFIFVHSKVTVMLATMWISFSGEWALVIVRQIGRLTPCYSYTHVRHHL
jgi:hypothetical protein